MHPLSGANIGTLYTVFRDAGGVSPKKLGKVAAIWLAALGRWPLSAGERLAIDPHLPELDALAPPVFILGHWRSGTTHLYNALAKADWGFVPPVATGLPWDLLGLAKWIEPMLERQLPQTRYIDNIPVKPDSPQEDEIALANMTPVSFYHGIYFPEILPDKLAEGVFFDGLSAQEIAAWTARFTYFLRKLSVHQQGKRLLIKNPVYTARLGLLRQTLPSAKYVHIVRNPYEVFASMRNFYAKLIAEFSLQDAARDDVDALILATYDRMMRAIETDSAGLAAPAFIEVRYEELDRDPLTVLERFYRELELGDFARWRPVFADYLASVKGFEKNKFAYSDDAARLVETYLGYWLDKWRYSRPGG